MSRLPVVLAAVAFVAGLYVATAGVAFGKLGDERDRAEKAEAMAEALTFTPRDKAELVRAAFADAKAETTADGVLLWIQPDGTVVGTDEEARVLGGGKYKALRASLLQGGSRLVSRTCATARSADGSWTAGYCVDDVQADGGEPVG